MFYYLEGTVTVIGQNFAVVDVGGAGYRCNTTLNTLSKLEKGKKARLYTYCNIKEDAFNIYGFYDEKEENCFELLLSVSGVGPKAAAAILSAAPPEELVFAIVTEDERALTAAPGIGKRIAQRIILELKDKLQKGGIEAVDVPSAAVPAASGSDGRKVADASAALAVLGYSQSEINAALRGVDVNALSVEQIIRQVLKGSVKEG